MKTGIERIEELELQVASLTCAVELLMKERPKEEEKKNEGLAPKKTDIVRCSLCDDVTYAPFAKAEVKLYLHDKGRDTMIGLNSNTDVYCCESPGCAIMFRGIHKNITFL